MAWRPPVPEPSIIYSLIKIAGVTFLIGPFAAVTAKRYVEAHKSSTDPKIALNVAIFKAKLEEGDKILEMIQHSKDYINKLKNEGKDKDPDFANVITYLEHKIADAERELLPC